MANAMRHADPWMNNDAAVKEYQARNAAPVEETQPPKAGKKSEPARAAPVVETKQAASSDEESIKEAVIALIEEACAKINEAGALIKTLPKPQPELVEGVRSVARFFAEIVGVDVAASPVAKPDKGAIEVHIDNPRVFIESVGAPQAEFFARAILAVLGVVWGEPSPARSEAPVAKPLSGLDAGQIVDLILELPKGKVNAIVHDLVRETTAKPVAAPEVNEAPPAAEASHLDWKKTTGPNGYCFEAGNYFIAPTLNAEKKFCGCTVSYKGEVLARSCSAHQLPLLRRSRAPPQCSDSVAMGATADTADAHSKRRF
jgi:hypothetical protein